MARSAGFSDIGSKYPERRGFCYFLNVRGYAAIVLLRDGGVLRLILVQ
ncbi:MAG: hypothetical protein M1294_04125 [Firmicutes bacterium]|nr:hypothetical protein [Bacillota bacterium]MCL5013713.1 hypothetical protein [Bacillota bacterium]